MSVDTIDATEKALIALARAAKLDPAAAQCAAFVFLDECGAGVPDVPMLQENVRRDAQMWADCAAPHELEAYIAAAISALDNGSAVLKNQMKRLGALAYRRMGADGREGFKQWMDRQG